MSTVNLNKSLDDIIGSKPRPSSGERRRGGRKSSTKTASGGVTKSSSGKKKDVSKIKETSTESSKKRRSGRSSGSGKVNEDDPFYQATKVNISNMPTDINDVKIKQYLNKEFGNVKHVEGLYGKNGKPTGRFVVEFSVEGKALAAFKKLHGMPMDDGARILAVEILTDPTKKSLASRFGAKPEAAKPVKATKAAAEPKATKSKSSRGKASGKAGKVRAERTKRPALKTAEELDAEMDDYHNQNDAIIA